MIKNMVFLILVTSTALAASAPSLDEKKVETWIGQEEDAVISFLNSRKTKYMLDGAGIKEGTAQVVYNVTDPKKPFPVYFWVSPVSKTASTISGVLKIPKLKKDESFGYDCDQLKNMSIVAIVKKKKQVATLPALKAWSIDSASGKFKEVPAKGISCTNSAIF